MSTARDPLLEVANWAPEQTRPETNIPVNGSTFDLESFIRRSLNVKQGPVSYNGGLKWILEVCPFNPEHTGGCAVVTQTPEGKIGFRCQHDSCRDKHWREVRDLFDGPRLKSRSPESKQAARAPDGGGPKIRSIADLPSIRTYAAQKIDYVIEGILAAGTVTLISGESGHGKSTFANAMASCIERGVPFAGLKTQRRPVLVLDKENPLAIVIERLERLGVDVSENFKIWGGWCEEEPPQPGAMIVVQWVMGCDPKPVIIVDSLIGFFEGDENNASEVRQYMHAFRQLANMGATVVVLHHPGKGESSKDYRGSSDIKASIDVGYKLTNQGDVSRLTSLHLAAFKARFTVETEAIFHYRDGEFQMDRRPVVQMNEDIIRNLLVNNPGIRKEEFEKIALEKGVTRSRLRTFLVNSIGSGAVRVEPGPKNAIRHFWVGVKRDED